MTLVASFLFLAALALSFFAISYTVSEAMPRITEVIEDALGPQGRKQRVVTTPAPRIQLAAMPRPLNTGSFRRSTAMKASGSRQPQPIRMAA